MDAVFERDLETFGAVALDHRVSVGASGFGLGLARALVKSGRVTPASAAGAAAESGVGGLAACLAGSCSQATLAQIATADRAMPVLRLEPEKLVTGSAEAEQARLAGPLSGSAAVLC